VEGLEVCGPTFGVPTIWVLGDTPPSFIHVRDVEHVVPFRTISDVWLGGGPTNRYDGLPCGLPSAGWVVA